VNQKIKDLILFLILEIASIVWAAVVFSVISKKIIAGAMAASYFVVFSSFMFYRILHWPKPWTAWTLYPLCAFLFGVALPMTIGRFMHPTLEFSKITIMGMSGPEFHHVSTSVLGLLMIVTLAETVKCVLQRRKN
jgi:hypothetical protein